ncbi:MAG TPA: hypothetical protein VFV42_02830 [Acidimicrobiales bacterium]|nr:hypothetical protein [Acidimicrobiales bacterium]
MTDGMHLTPAAPGAVTALEDDGRRWPAMDDPMTPVPIQPIWFVPGLALAHQLYIGLQAQGRGRNGTQALVHALASLSGSTWPPAPLPGPPSTSNDG